jgi:hypothetical protein
VPGKARYELFEENPDIEFDYFLAETLKKTVADIRQMSNIEWLEWGTYFSRKAQAIELETKSAQ